MSTKELCIQLLESLPESKLGYVLAYMQGLSAEEAEDAAFCESLYQEYLADPDKGQAVTIEEAAQMLGVEL